MAVTSCRHFNGYKPCTKSEVCSNTCAFKSIPTTSVLIVHLGALGAVVRSTSLLPAIHRKYPGAMVTWVTDAPADQLLRHNPLIDRVVKSTDHLEIQALEFDVALVVDKSLKAAGIASLAKAKKVFGFQVDPKNGAIKPATPAAQRLWELGIDNHQKFFVNRKAETELMIEALELGSYRRDEYQLPLTPEEIGDSLRRRITFQKTNDLVIGFNTGCSSTIAAKKWTVEHHRKVIRALQADGYKNIVLLGGREDSERNQQIAEGLNVIQSPTTAGLRDGLISLDACDIVVTGDSLGMHMAIARKKYVVAWFGPTCSHEIDLYGRGQSLLADVDCAPCWKRSCHKSVMCYDQVEVNAVISAVRAGMEWYKAQNPFWLSKLPSLEISS